MEVILAAGLALALIAAVAAWSRSRVERAQVRRLSEELSELKRATLAARPVDVDAAEVPAVASSTRMVALGASALDARKLAAHAGTALALLQDARAQASAAPDARRLEELRALAISATRAAETFTDLRRAAAALPERLPRQEVTPAPRLPREVRGAEAVVPLSAAVERASDELLPLRDEMLSLERQTARLVNRAAGAREAMSTLERASGHGGPASATLAALANRINLVALNVAVLGSSGAAAEPGVPGASGHPRGGPAFEQAGNELRALFEEARRLARELQSGAQRAADAARAARDALDELVSLASDEAARVSAGGQRVTRAQQAVEPLAEGVDAALAAVRELAGAYRRALELLDEAFGREGLRAAERETARQELLAYTSRQESAAAVLGDLDGAARRLIEPLTSEAPESRLARVLAAVESELDALLLALGGNAARERRDATIPPGR